MLWYISSTTSLVEDFTPDLSPASLAEFGPFANGGRAIFACCPIILDPVYPGLGAVGCGTLAGSPEYSWLIFDCGGPL